MPWALQNIDHHVKLSSLGRKKIDGQELDAIDYLSKSDGNMTVKLYFDPETHHHVMTVYAVNRSANVAHTDIENAHQQ